SGCRALFPLVKQRSQSSLRLSHADAWAQPSHDLDPVAMLIEIGFRPHAPWNRSLQRHIGMDGEIKVWRGGRIDAEEFRRRNSYHRDWNAVDQYGLPHSVRGASKVFLAESKAGNGHQWRFHSIVVR